MDRERALESRLYEPYRITQLRAARRIQANSERLTELIEHDAPLRYIAEYTDINAIAADLVKCAVIARALISTASLSVFNGGYKQGVTEAGIKVAFELRDVTGLFHGKSSPFGKLPGYKGSFEKVGARHAYDMQRGRFYYQRALGKLGDNKAIVGRLKNELAQHIMMDNNISQLVRRIQRVTEGSYKQALTIARTEKARAYSQGKMLAMYQALADGVDVVKKWHAMMTYENVRESHEAIHGEIAEPHKPFSNGLHYPLDPNGEAAEVINCRCHLKIIKI